MQARCSVPLDHRDGGCWSAGPASSSGPLRLGRRHDCAVHDLLDQLVHIHPSREHARGARHG